MHRRTHCAKGHAYPPDAIRGTDGGRLCRICIPDVMCRQCGLRPRSRRKHPFCSKTCSNAARARTLRERFHDFYQPGEPDACWPWQGSIDGGGYGVITDDNKRQLRAHRVAYELTHGVVPPGKNVMHSCDNPPCCNPAHLRPGTVAENNEDKRLKNRHPYGSKSAKAKLNESDIREIRDGIAAGLTDAVIAPLYHVTPAAIWFIRVGRTWKHVR
jgi:hypothetical protein